MGALVSAHCKNMWHKLRKMQATQLEKFIYTTEDFVTHCSSFMAVETLLKLDVNILCFAVRVGLSRRF